MSGASLAANTSPWRLPTAKESVNFVGGVASGTPQETSWLRWTPYDEGVHYESRQYTLPSPPSDPSNLDYGGKHDYFNRTDHAGNVGDPYTGSFPVVANRKDAAFSQVLPAAGRRQYGDGRADFVGKAGFYWSSTARSANSGYGLNFGQDCVELPGSSLASSGNPVRCVEITGALPPSQPEGVKAPKNVIGYYYDNVDRIPKLTLDERGPLGEDVYVAYFKRGSTIAIDGGAGDFSANNIVAAKGYKGKTDASALAAIREDVNAAGVPGRDQWFAFHHGTISGSTADGAGDACANYFPGYRMPTQDENNALFAGNTYTWTANGTPSVENPGIGTFANGVKLPAAGCRIGWSGTVREQGSNGYYWSSTGGGGPTSGHALVFNSTSPPYSNLHGDAWGLAVRCVEDTTPPASGVPAPAGVLGYYATDGPGTNPSTNLSRKAGDLTLEGDEFFGGSSPVPVYVAYFKWGSLIATDGGTGDFSSANILAAEGYKGYSNAAALAVIRAEVDLGGWAKIPYADSDEWPDYDEGNVSGGRGDACKHYFGPDYKTSTKNEFNDLLLGNYTWTANGSLSASNPGIGTFINGVELPAAGRRTSTYGTVTEQGSGGYYWSNSLLSSSISYFLTFDAGGKSSGNSSRTNGYALRCVHN
jgi:hypothetical protein